MAASFLQIIGWLIVSVLVIIVLTSKFRLHPFFVLLMACFIVGLGIQLPPAEILSTIKDGFGNILKSLGLIVVLGTTLGVILEHTGSTEAMALYILKKTGDKNAALAVSITGFIVGLPVFCDSGFIVLSGLNKSLSKRTGIPIPVMAISMATALYGVHCLLPPHPGATAAAVTIGVDIGKLMLMGIFVSIPATIVGFLWSNYEGKKGIIIENAEKKDIPKQINQSYIITSFLPILVPVALIAIKSLTVLYGDAGNILVQLFSILGDPSIALITGVLLALINMFKQPKARLTLMLQEAAEKAGGILIIIGAGGAFGAVLSATKIGDHFAHMPISGAGIILPFLLAVILKTAQGSSTVAIITASSIVKPLLPVLGLATAKGMLLAVLSMGAGSMMISHANDAYFWVISRFSEIEMKPMLRTYSIASILMGITSFLIVYLFSILL